MGFLDTDEFLIIKDGTPHMPALLKEYEEYGGLGVHWVMFGSSGHKTRPAKGVLASYWQCLWHGSPHSRHIRASSRWAVHVYMSTVFCHLCCVSPLRLAPLGHVGSACCRCWA